MPVWQRIYEEIDNPDFVIICAAQDTGGEAVAGPIFDAAGATYIQIVDENHRISSLFNFVNVPSSAWIDETGRIVRIDEGTYSQIHAISDGQETITFGNDVYTPALKDWIENGENSPYINAPEQVSENIRTHSKEQLKAGLSPQFCAEMTVGMTNVITLNWLHDDHYDTSARFQSLQRFLKDSMLK